jgi:rare lipoprotein A (peptidoglycan hydrolase)
LSIAFRRVWLLTNIVVTVALLPALFPDHSGGGGTAVAAGAAADAVVATHLVDVTSTPSTMVVTTTTTAAPPPTTPPTTSAPKVVAAAAKPKPKPTTTTTAKPRPRPTTTTTAPPPPATPAASGSESGKATWYDYKPGICAHKTLPFGTVVTVHAVNGKSVQCTVGDRGPYVDGYVIDLNSREFEQLAPTSAGRIDVTITW